MNDEVKVIVVEKINELDGASYKEVEVDKDTAMFLLNSDSITVEGLLYKIIHRISNTRGEIFLFVENELSYSVDDDFITKVIKRYK